MKKGRRTVRRVGKSRKSVRRSRKSVRRPVKTKRKYVRRSTRHRLTRHHRRGSKYRGGGTAAALFKQKDDAEAAATARRRAESAEKQGRCQECDFEASGASMEIRQGQLAEHRNDWHTANAKCQWCDFVAIWGTKAPPAAKLVEDHELTCEGAIAEEERIARRRRDKVANAQLYDVEIASGSQPARHP
jgi:hypothetical protein